MVREEIGEPEKSDEGEPPRDAVNLGILSSLYNRHSRAKAKKKKAYTDHQRNERTVAQWSVRVGLFTAILAATSVFGNWVIYKQLREMQSSGEDTKRLIAATEKSAQAAQDAVKLAEDTAKRQLRAYVFAEKFEIGGSDKKIGFVAKFKDTGQTPAFRATINGLLSVERMASCCESPPS